MTMLDKVLAMDLENLTQEEKAWLHKLKTLATTMSGRLQLKHAKENNLDLHW